MISFRENYIHSVFTKFIILISERNNHQLPKNPLSVLN